MKTIAMVTGASKGLGLALAEQLARECDTLITVARQRHVHSVSDIASHSACQHIHYAADLSDMAQVTALCKKLNPILQTPVQRYLLINNAGALGPMAQYHGLESSLSAQIAQTFNLNISAVITLTSHFLTLCEQHNNAKVQVINISSGAARNAYPGWGVYCASKAALDRYSEVAQLEAPFAQIVSLAPGVIDTDMQANIRSSNEKDFPNLQRFKDLHANQALSSATETAQKILAYSQRADFGQQTLSDIRLI